MKTEFMRNMEHDIRTPFSGIWSMGHYLWEMEEDEVKKEFGISLLSETTQLKKAYGAIILTVAHKEFKGFDLDRYTEENSVIFDVKSFLPKDKIDGSL